MPVPLPVAPPREALSPRPAALCTYEDLQRLGREFGLTVPEPGEDEEPWDEVVFFHSELRPDPGMQDLEGLARLLGFWVEAEDPVWTPLAGLDRLDVLYES